MSLREAERVSPAPAQRRTRAEHGSNGERPSSGRDQRSRNRPRRHRDGTSRSRANTGQLPTERPDRPRGRSESQQRQIGHQSSIRSLISSADMSERDIEREIEDFARQIQEEGLLDGLDLDNIDLSRDDDLSRRITEAYRRRQRGRDRETARPDNGSAAQDSAAQSQSPGDDARDTHLRIPESNSQSRRSETSTSRPSTAASQSDSQSRTSPSRPPTRDVQGATRGARRRTASAGRSATEPIHPAPDADIRPAARSQTDLSLRSELSDTSLLRPNNSEVRSSSVPSAPAPSELPGSNPSNQASFANRVAQPSSINTADSSRETNSRVNPTELAVVHSAATSPMSSPGQTGHKRGTSLLYPEPSISCARCNKPHIEYEIHYNCAVCAGGQWNMCMDCYRDEKGCQYWFGFGHGGWNKWRRLCQERGDDSLAEPHVLIPSRYLPPPSTPGGADGRKTLTTDDPKLRLETGTFCARCQGWTNDCYWRCDVCNHGEWGFCNNCVNQGKCCTHMLLPLSHDVPQPHSRSPGKPRAARVVTESQSRSISPFRPLYFATTCDICRNSITPSDVRYHCYSCISALVQNAAPGDYDICASCYGGLVERGQISTENGHSGWRRCLKGHRMAMIGFANGEVGWWRYIERDVVGGRKLRTEAVGGEGQQSPSVQKWTWKRDTQKNERLVTHDVAASAPQTLNNVTYTQEFPPDGGLGLRALAKWAWYPKSDADDELLFPRGAEIREIEDVNGDWFFGVYMGEKGLFPSGYVRLQRESGSVG